MVNPDDLIVQAQEGNTWAFNKLADRWYPIIYNFAHKYFADEDKAMEITQQTFIAVYQNLHSLQDVRKFRSWIYRIAHNACHNLYQKERKNPFLSIFRAKKSEKNELNEYLPIADENNTHNPLNFLERQENIGLVQKALSQINPDQKVVIIMKEFEGMKFSEIAETLQVSENTAKARMYYGLQALRKILEKQID